MWDRAFKISRAVFILTVSILVLTVLTNIAMPLEVAALGVLGTVILVAAGINPLYGE